MARFRGCIERDNDNREYRRMARQGTLEGYLASKVRATRDYAGWLIKQNEMPSHAWRRAIRTLILEREED